MIKMFRDCFFLKKEGMEIIYFLPEEKIAASLKEEHDALQV